MKALFVEYGWLIKMLGSAAIAFLFAYLAGRTQAETRAGWKYSTYPFAVKLFAVLFAAVMTAAVIQNGMKLFASDWWVPPVITLLFVGGYWLLYEVFVTRLRWNDERFELRRYESSRVS